MAGPNFCGPVGLRAAHHAELWNRAVSRNRASSRASPSRPAGGQVIARRSTVVWQQSNCPPIPRQPLTRITAFVAPPAPLDFSRCGTVETWRVCKTGLCCSLEVRNGEDNAEEAKEPKGSRSRRCQMRPKSAEALLPSRGTAVLHGSCAAPHSMDQSVVSDWPNQTSRSKQASRDHFLATLFIFISHFDQFVSFD